MYRILMFAVFIVISASSNAHASSFKLRLENGDYHKREFTKMLDDGSFTSGEDVFRLWGIEVASNYPKAEHLLKSFMGSNMLDCTPQNFDDASPIVLKCFHLKNDLAATFVEQGLAKDSSYESRGLYKPQEDIAKAKKKHIWAE